MTARMCEVADTLGEVVKRNLNKLTKMSGNSLRSKSIPDIGERRTLLCQTVKFVLI